MIMETAKILKNGGIRLPKKFHFDSNEIVVQRLGDAVLLVPKDSLWKTFTEGLDSFTSDIFEEGRNQGEQVERECL